jgi:AcrR family transcriptional regulator
MSDVKNRRRYDSRRRREQAATTRREILEAAQRLFERQGFATTTVAEIAAEAGVAVKTVYLAFETKSGVLRALWNALLRGGDDDIPVAAQEWYREAVDEPAPERQLRLNARNSREAKLRIGAVLEVIRGAAGGDDELDALWKRIQTEYHANQAVLVKSLDEKGALRPELGVERATDILWTLNHPSIWRLLVQERGWSPEEYEQWCGDVACEQLLKRSP